MVSPFATEAARDSAITAPVEGMLSYQADSDAFTGYTGSAWVEATRLGAWTDYTPTLTQSGAVTKTVTSARWVRAGRRVSFQVVLTATGSGTANNVVLVGLPVAAVATLLPMGSGMIFDTSASTFYSGLLLGGASASVAQIVANGNVIGLGGTSAVFAAALASGDIIYAAGTYEAAA